jgi:hypothetical protein
VPVNKECVRSMVKRTVEIEDNLDEIISSAKEDVKALIEEYIKDNESKPDYSTLDYSGSMHEIFDGAVPIYTGEINDLFYLYGDDFEEAFDNAGIGDKDDDHWPMGWKPAAIYCYIEREINNDLDEMIDEIWDAWEEKQNEDVTGVEE